MADTNRRVPLWLIALAGGLGVFTRIMQNIPYQDLCSLTENGIGGIFCE